MIIWLDAQLSPALAPWIHATFGLEALALRDVGLRDSTDREIFCAAKEAGAIVMTKDSDFVTLHSQLGAPPQIIWLTCWEHVKPVSARVAESGSTRGSGIVGGRRAAY